MKPDSIILEYPEYSIFELNKKKNKYCVCIPVINEGHRIQNQLKKMSIHSSSVDIIIADGGSTDNSLDLDFLSSVGVRTLLVKRGSGKLSSQLRMAYHYSIIVEEYDGVITIDGNDKDDVNTIPYFIEKLEEGYDFIQGSRYLPGGAAINTPLIRYIAMKYIHVPILSYVSGFSYTDTTNGYRGYSANLVQCSKLQIFREIFSGYELLAYVSAKAPRLGCKTIEVPVKRMYPNKGEIPTKISFFKGNFELLKILLKILFNKFDFD